MPSTKSSVDLKTLRDLFRGLQIFESHYESMGIDTIRDPSGIEWSVWDVQYLFACRGRLSPRQAQAIELCLYHNVKESDAALLMGIQETSPVSIYANNGLRRIIQMIDEGLLPKFDPLGRAKQIAEEAAAEAVAA